MVKAVAFNAVGSCSKLLFTQCGGDHAAYIIDCLDPYRRCLEGREEIYTIKNRMEIN